MALLVDATTLLATRARSVTAVDAAPEMLALARQRVRGLPVEFIEADVFAWQPPRRYDTVFFAFWLTHVPPTRFTAFWSMVGAALAPGGRVCFLDDSDQARAGERVVADQAIPAVWRRLRDGSQHRVVKVYYSPGELVVRLAELGWSAEIRQTSIRLRVARVVVAFCSRRPDTVTPNMARAIPLSVERTSGVVGQVAGKAHAGLGHDPALALALALDDLAQLATIPAKGTARARKGTQRARRR